MPLGGFSISSIAGWLSWNSISFHGTPSLMWSSSSVLKTQVRKNWRRKKKRGCA